MGVHILCSAQLLVKGCVETRPQAEGSYNASLGFPFLVIMLFSVLCRTLNNLSHENLNYITTFNVPLGNKQRICFLLTYLAVHDHIPTCVLETVEIRSM